MAKQAPDDKASQELMEISIRNLLKSGKTETEVRRIVERQLNKARRG